MNDILINTEFIRLDQFLKLANLASSGGEAKYLILESHILINGEEEQRRGRKIRDGDIVNFNGIEYKIIRDGGTK